MGGLIGMGTNLIAGTAFEAQMAAVRVQMQQDTVNAAKRDAENAKIQKAAESQSKAASAATHIKINYQ
ncbi:hypothetical protein ACVLVH_004643 [Kluyvera sp. 1366]|jgi:hypothetical protein